MKATFFARTTTATRKSTRGAGRLASGHADRDRPRARARVTPRAQPYETTRASTLGDSGTARVLWITGLPASGKTSLALRLCTALQERGMRATLIDSDEVRSAITPTASYAAEERLIVYRTIAYVAARLANEGVIAVVAATAHDAKLRRAAREILENVFVVYARCPIEVCESRDPRGLYAQARAVLAANMETTFPGVGEPYEPPDDADLVVDTSSAVPQAVIERTATAFAGDEEQRAHAPSRFS